MKRMGPVGGAAYGMPRYSHVAPASLPFRPPCGTVAWHIAFDSDAASPLALELLQATTHVSPTRPRRGPRHTLADHTIFITIPSKRNVMIARVNHFGDRVDAGSEPIRPGAFASA